MSNTVSIRLSNEFIKFLERASTNRIIIGNDKSPKKNPDMSRILVKYFKLDNDRYQELIAMEDDNV